MTEEQIYHYCQLQSKINHICIRVYKDSSISELIKCYSEEPDIDRINFIHKNVGIHKYKPNNNIAIIDHKQLVLGFIVDSKTGKAFLIGPVKLGGLTTIEIQELMMSYRIPRIYEKSVSSFFSKVPTMPIESFLMSISAINLVINETIVNMEEMIDKVPDKPLDPEDEHFIETAENLIPHTDGKYEQRISYIIQNGMVEELEKLKYESFDGFMGKLGPSQLRSLKNGIIILNAICLRSAIAGGLDTETAYSLGELYAQKIEDCKSISDLGSISSTIRRDYCQRVRNLNSPKIDNIHVSKTTEFIQNNVYKKITAKEIADKLGITKEYLSSLAHKHLGMTIPQYINKIKINEGKKLLRFTNKPIAEIAELLSFSSQSHFQNQFKKIRGLTPDEYRKKYSKSK